MTMTKSHVIACAAAATAIVLSFLIGLTSAAFAATAYICFGSLAASMLILTSRPAVAPAPRPEIKPVSEGIRVRAIGGAPFYARS
jgi:hypothetical protein